MSKEPGRFNPSKMPAAIQRLAEHLATLNAQDELNLPMESDMLSLIVSGALHAEDVSRRYPSFYKKMLENAELRQVFLDALGSIETERAGQLVSMPGPSSADLSFLERQPSAPIVQMLDGKSWRATWQKSLEQIRSIFTPSELAYRADPDLVEDPWFTLLRDEVTAAGTTYAVTLDCIVSNELDNALSALLNLAVTVESPLSGAGPFLLRASLHWGAYQESVLISEEGRAKFPDIPIAAISDQSKGQIQAGLSLILESAA